MQQIANTFPVRKGGKKEEGGGGGGGGVTASLWDVAPIDHKRLTFHFPQ